LFKLFGMPSWSDVEAQAPELAHHAAALFSGYRHHTMATLRADGSPRISGTEVWFEEGDLWLGMMAGALRARDLARDPRVALHSHSIDPPAEDPASWAGEAKVAGRAVPAGLGEEGSHRFRIDVAEVVLTRVGPSADHLLIVSWHPDRGVTRLERR
jgi:hypothetical protein